MRVYRINGYMSEYQRLETRYSRDERRHALSLLLGSLTGVLWAGGLVYMLS